MNEIGASKTPTGFWVIAGLSLLWNGYGGVDYTLTRLRNMDFLTSVAGSREKAEAMLASIDAMPLLAQLGWGLGVWSSVLGSILLLLRSRHAASAFLLSLVGAVVSFGFQIGSMPADMNTPSGWIMIAVIIGAIVFFWWYARRATAQGILR
jgi:hypothetical protein